MDNLFENMIDAIRLWLNSVVENQQMNQADIGQLAQLLGSNQTTLETLAVSIENTVLAVTSLTSRIDQLEKIRVPSPTPVPDPEPEPTPVPDPEPEPEVPAPVMGIWASRTEIMARPTSGEAWSRLLADAQSNWGSANLGDNNSTHDVKTLAGAIASVRLSDDAMRNKVIVGLKSAMVSGFSRTLELSRGLQGYIVAADIIGYRDEAFMQWVADMVVKPLSGHSGGVGILGTAQKSSNNWGGHARSSLAAAAIYLDRDDWKKIAVDAQREFIGLDVTKPVMSFTSTNWHANAADKAGVNRKGSKINGVSVSGVLPEDWRRATSFRWLPATSGYFHEGLQGFVSTAIILHRAGLMPFNSGDDAVVRSFNMIYGRGEAASNNPVFTFPCEGDDAWLPWAVNRYGGSTFPTIKDGVAGKGLGYAEWLMG